MNLVREIFQAIAIKLGFMADQTVNPTFRLKRKRTNLCIFLLLLIHLILAPKIWGTACLIQGTVGIPCPTCGSTRAFFHLIRGHFHDAFYWHPLIILSLFILIAGFVFIISQEVKKQRAFREGKTYQPRYAGKKFWYVFVPVLTLYLIIYVVRLIRLYPNPPMNYNELSMLGRLLGRAAELFK